MKALNEIIGKKVLVQVLNLNLGAIYRVEGYYGVLSEVDGHLISVEDKKGKVTIFNTMSSCFESITPN